MRYVPVQEDGTDWSGLLSGGAECGSDRASNQRAQIDIVNLDTRQSINSRLIISWCKMQSGKYEVIAYLS